MLQKLRQLIPERHPVRLAYHKLNAILAATTMGFPASRVTIIGVTGTSGKTTTAGIIHHLFQSANMKCGLISTTSFYIGDQFHANTSLRTTLRCWHTQWLLRRMVLAGCKHIVIEVSSHALDQNRLWGVNFDVAVLTNISENEHLDYHGDFTDYLQAKRKLFTQLNSSSRKPNIPKTLILNQDDEHIESFEEIISDKKWTYGLKKSADYMGVNVDLNAQKTSFTLSMPNHKQDIQTRIIGQHNLENILAAIATSVSMGVSVESIEPTLSEFTGIPGRLESIVEGQNFPVVVDFSYKPSALQAVLSTLRTIITGRIIVIWGGAGGRSHDNRIESAQIIRDLADEFILTTDDPYNEDPKIINQTIIKALELSEGDRFFEIEDRYTAIQYGVFTAGVGDCVLIAGRGHEDTQTIGQTKIKFDDRDVAREILQFSLREKRSEI